MAVSTRESSPRSRPVGCPPENRFGQFKSSDLSPGECRSELRGARFAIDRMRAGAIVRCSPSGRLLVKERKDERAAAVRAEAEALGLSPENTRLYDGKPTGCGGHPSFPARSSIDASAGQARRCWDFDRWRKRSPPSRALGSVWESVRHRTRRRIDRNGRASGISHPGRVRPGQVQARHGSRCEMGPTRPLVVCAPWAADLTTEVLGYLVDGERSLSAGPWTTAVDQSTRPSWSRSRWAT